MHKVFTTALVQLFINDGYQYMLYRHIQGKKRLSGVNIIFKPVKQLSEGDKKHNRFDNCVDLYKKFTGITWESLDDSCMLIDLSDAGFEYGCYHYCN